MASNPKTIGSAIVYSGGSIPLPAVMKGDFYAWATKRYISGIELKIKDLKEEIAANAAEIEKLSKVRMVDNRWVEILIQRNAHYETMIAGHRAKIVELEAKPFTASDFSSADSD